MRVIICGSRSFANHPNMRRIFLDAIRESQFPISFVISGGARGIDRYSILWAKEQGLPFHEEKIPSEEWQRLGKGAGHDRNLRMAHLIPPPDAVLAIHDGLSNGTIDMLTIMRDLGKPWHLKTVFHSFR